jgi:hypothetical protein
MSRAFWLACVVVGLAVGAMVWKWMGRNTAVRVAAEGSVTMSGRPLEHAVIRFVPLDSKRSARATGAEIVGGKYRIAAEDGLVVGRYRVEISPYVAPNFEQHPAGRPVAVPRTALIPPQYNTHSKLFVDVKSDEPQRFDLALQSGGR